MEWARRLALPYLDAMIPVRRRCRNGRRPAAEGTRLVCIEQVHGAAGCNALGATKFLWAPAATGSNFELAAENALVAARRRGANYLTIVSNTDVRMAEAFAPPEIGGDHFRSSAMFLTQCHPKQTQGSDL